MLPSGISRPCRVFATLIIALVTASCGESVTLIHEVQGAGTASPMTGEEIVVEAIVTAVFQGPDELGGLFLQEEDADADADPLTSEGLFVFTATPAAVGDRVRVRGTVIESFDHTELNPVTELEVISSGHPLPKATPLTLPLTSADEPERYEGMRIDMPSGLYISDVYSLWAKGEFVVSSAPRFQPTAVTAPGAPAIAMAASNALDALLVDDGRIPQNLPVNHPGQNDAGPFDAANPIRAGQTIDGLNGVLHQAFNRYRLQRIGPYVIEESANPRTEKPDDVGGTLTVAALNVLNFFSTVDIGAAVCGPLSDQACRGADSAAEQLRQTDKLVATLAALDADVVGLVELENNTSASLEFLVGALNAVVGAGSYTWVNTGAIGGDAIKTGLIYRPARVTPEGDFALLTTAVDSRFNDQFSRPSLAQSFRAGNNQALFTVVVNHLKSKGSNCDELGDPDRGDGQGNCNHTRTLAAAALGDWVNADPTGTGSDKVLVLGDLNAYAKEDPIAELEGKGLTNLLDLFEGPDAYTYTYGGQRGSLDYALATASLLPHVTGATAWHSNADEAVALDYNEELGKPAQYYQPDPYSASDHDPVLVGLDLPPAAEAASGSH